MVKRQHADVTVKIPKQKRSETNVSAILEASARVLEREGLAGFNTNRIAAEAGVGIGTLYQFFRSKEAILVAIARRQLDADRAAIMSALASVMDDPHAPIERIVIRAVIAAYSRHTTMRKLVMQTMIGLGLGAEVALPGREVAGLLNQRIARTTRIVQPSKTPMRLFIVTCAVEAAIRAAAYERMPFFGTPEFEDELVHMVRSFLSTPSENAMD